VTTVPAAKKRKVVPASSAPKKATSAKPGHTLKPVPNKTAKSRTRSVSIEEVPDEDDFIPPKPPHNPQSILEHVGDEVPTPSASDGEPEVIEVLEESEEDDEAELSEQS
jgi:hypothetical protein